MTDRTVPAEGGGGGGGNFGALQTMLNGGNYDQFDLLRQNATDNTLPQSYINYMMFDEQMQLLPAQSGAIQVKSASADAWSVTGTEGSINITNNGTQSTHGGNRNPRLAAPDLKFVYKRHFYSRPNLIDYKMAISKAVR